MRLREIFRRDDELADNSQYSRNLEKASFSNICRVFVHALRPKEIGRRPTARSINGMDSKDHGANFQMPDLSTGQAKEYDYVFQKNAL